MRVTGQLVCTLLGMLLAAPVGAASDVDAVAAAIANGGDADMLREQLRSRLGDNGTVCDADEKAACQKKLQEQVRTCLQLGKKTGSIESSEDAAKVAAAVMLMAQKGDAEQAGDLVRAQLQHKWKAAEIDETAGQMRQLRHRWRHQVMGVVSGCTNQGTCSPEEARAAVEAMTAAAKRADEDPRRVARTVRSAMAEHAGAAKQAKNRSRSANAAQLKTMLQKRLCLKGEGGTGTTVGEGEQLRHQYRHQMDGEGRRGGKFGGNASSGEGVGAGPGAGPRWGR